MFSPTVGLNENLEGAFISSSVDGGAFMARVPSVGKWRRNSANTLLVAPSKPRVDFLRFHRSKTEERSLICRTEPDKRGLPLERAAIVLHITFCFLMLPQTHFTRSPKICLNLLSDNHST